MTRRSVLMLLPAALLLVGCGGGGSSSSAYSTAQYTIYYQGVPPATDVITAGNGDKIVGNQVCVTFSASAASQDILNIAAKYKLSYIVYGVTNYDYYVYVIPDQRSAYDLAPEIAKEPGVQKAAVEAAAVPNSLASYSLAGCSVVDLGVVGTTSPPSTDGTAPNGLPYATNQFTISFYRATTMALENQIAEAIASKYGLGKTVYFEFNQYLYTIPDGSSPFALVAQINADPTIEEANVEYLGMAGSTGAAHK